MYFTTKDSDNDLKSINCAGKNTTQPFGGWWHKSFWTVNPNNYYKHNKYGIFLNDKWDPINHPPS